MKKHFFFLLVLLTLTAAATAQDAKEMKPKARSPHLTFTLYQNEFYYTKGAEKEKRKLDLVDSSAIARLIDSAIVENKVDKKDLALHLEGDNLMDHPKFELLLNTILSRTVSEVRVKTNVFD